MSGYPLCFQVKGCSGFLAVPVCPAPEQEEDARVALGTGSWLCDFGRETSLCGLAVRKLNCNV